MTKDWTTVILINVTNVIDTFGFLSGNQFLLYFTDFISYVPYLWYVFRIYTKDEVISTLAWDFPYFIYDIIWLTRFFFKKRMEKLYREKEMLLNIEDNNNIV